MVYAGGALMDANVGLARIFQVAGIGLFAAGVLLFVMPFTRSVAPASARPGDPRAIPLET